MNSQAIREAREIVKNSKELVFFGGAGVSTASGIPDFRSENGWYATHANDSVPAEYYFSHEFSLEDSDGFADFTRSCYRSYQVKPSGAHLALKVLEDRGILKAIVTQNIDGLHQKAGNHRIYELHGNMRDIYCPHCGRDYDRDRFMEQKGAVACPHCGTPVRADVVLYGESLDYSILDDSVQAISEADTLIVGGSSLVVYPAAGLLQYFRGNKLILINRDPTPADRRADVVIRDDISEVMPMIAGMKEIPGDASLE